MDRFDRSFHRFSLWLSLACPATRWVVLSSLTYCWYWLQHVGFFEHRQSRAQCLEHVEEKSSIDKQSDSIGNQTVEIGVGLRVRFSKSRFWCRFWSRSCVISVSTDSQKKKSWKEKPIDEDLADSTGLMEKLRKRRAGLRNVYGKTTCTTQSVRGFAFFKHVKHALAMRILWRRRKHKTLGSQIFFHQQLELEARNTQTTVTLDCEKMVSWQEKKKEKKSKNKWTKTPDSRTGVLGPCVARDHCWALTRERKPMTKHERRIASELCAWFNYKKKGNAHILLDWFWEAARLQLAFEQTSGDPSPLSVDVRVLLTTIDTRWFMQENRS